MADKRAYDLTTLVDQQSAYILADRDDLAEAQKQLIVNLITQAVLQIFDNTDTGLTSTNTNAAIIELLDLIKQRAIWKGVWDESTQYGLGNMVKSGRWLMISIVESPAIGVSPVPTFANDPYYVINLPAVPAWETVNTTSWFYTALRGNVPKAEILRGCRAWLSNAADLRQIVLLSKVNAAGETVELEEFVFENGSVTTTGWVDLYLTDKQLIQVGETYEVGLFVESLGGETQLFNSTWIYTGVNNNQSSVYYGSACENSANNVLYIHEYSTANLNPDFSTLQAEDIVTMSIGSAEWSFELNAVPTLTNSVWEFTGYFLYKIDVINPGDVVDFDFVRPGGGSLDYVKITDGLSSFPNFVGLLDELETNDVYGVDFIIDDIVESTQWDIMSHWGNLFD